MQRKLIRLEEIPADIDAWNRRLTGDTIGLQFSRGAAPILGIGSAVSGGAGAPKVGDDQLIAAADALQTEGRFEYPELKVVSHEDLMSSMDMMMMPMLMEGLEDDEDEEERGDGGGSMNLGMTIGRGRMSFSMGIGPEGDDEDGAGRGPGSVNPGVSPTGDEKGVGSPGDDASNGDSPSVHMPRMARADTSDGSMDDSPVASSGTPSNTYPSSGVMSTTGGSDIPAVSVSQGAGATTSSLDTMQFSMGLWGKKREPAVAPVAPPLPPYSGSGTSAQGVEVDVEAPLAPVRGSASTVASSLHDGIRRVVQLAGLRLGLSPRQPQQMHGVSSGSDVAPNGVADSSNRD